MRVVILLALLLGLPAAFAQSAPDPGQAHPRQPERICGPRHLDKCFLDLAHDQAGIWTSPLRVKSRDAEWIVPFAAATAVAIRYDAEAQSSLGVDPGRINASNSVAHLGSPLATIGAGAGLYAVGALSKDDKLRETGRLSAEAVIDATVVAEALKLATNRERPFQGAGAGRFWPDGFHAYRFDGSFPSGHAAGSWAFARVIALEYPRPLVRIALYGFATTISVVRVTGRDHFPSDVVVGSTFGYLIGGYVYHHRSAFYRKAGKADGLLLLTPVLDQRNHAYGARVELSPSALAHPVRALRASLP